MTDPSRSSRPLSPHLQVYRLPMTALMSISHRITGVILSGGCLLITAYLVCAAIGPEAFEGIKWFVTGCVGQVFLFLWLLVIYYHLCNGVRHLIWDTVHLFEKRNTAISGYVVLLATLGLTLATWYYAMKGEM